MATAPTTPASKPASERISPALSWRLVRADGRPADEVAFEESVVVFFLGAAAILGVPKSLAAIYGTCFASPQPLGFTEVRERLNISAGSISQGLRILREVGALKVVTAETDQRELFAPDMELRKLITHYIDERLETQLESGRIRLKAIGKSLPTAPNGSAKVLNARLKSLQSWHEKSRAVLPLIRGFLKLT